MTFVRLLLILVFLSPGLASAGETVYYLFRHAEKMAEGSDPNLTEEGHARAQNLAEMLKDAGVTRIFSSDYNRTKETVGPLAEATGLEIEIYDPRDLAGFAEQLKSMDGVIVVSGHSNTTPELTALLSGQETEPMPETEYDRLYQVILTDEGESILNVTRQK